MNHPEFSQLMRTPSVTCNIALIVIDEAHCIVEWGAEFRKDYAKLGTLRSYVALDVPILATSATLPPSKARTVIESLHLKENKLYYRNLGNNRPNIMPILITIKGGAKDLQALDFILDEPLLYDKPLVRTMVFVDCRILAATIWKYLSRQLPAKYASQIGFYHAARAAYAKCVTLEAFIKGDINVLISTDAAGMVSFSLCAYSR